MATTGILILGMHRSGTSVLSASLGFLGANLGKHLIAPRDDNKKGFFEDWRCVNTNIEILRQFRTDGHGGVALPGNWKNLSAVRQAADRIKTILTDLGAAPVYALKDPRLSLVADLWIEVACDLGHEIKLVVAGRHPLQVAQSLERRDKETRYRAYLMWLLYTWQAVQTARKHDHTYVCFEDLQSTPRTCLERVIALVNRLDVFYIDPDREKQVAEFLDPELISNRDIVDQHFPTLSKELNALYAALRAGDEARFDQCIRGGMLRMFTEMTASYRSYLGNLQFPVQVENSASKPSAPKPSAVAAVASGN